MDEKGINQPTERMEANMSSENMATTKTEKDGFDEGTNAELSLDDLEGAAGGAHTNWRWIRKSDMQPENPQPAKPDVVKFCVDCGATYMESQGHDCPEK